MRGDARVFKLSANPKKHPHPELVEGYSTRKFLASLKASWTVRDGAAYDGDQSIVSLRKGYQETLCSQPLGGTPPSAITTIGFFRDLRQWCCLDHRAS